MERTTWTVQSTPGTILNSVSCTSTVACTAVGSTSTGPVAERWNGTNWSTQSVPIPSGPISASLTGVSCTSLTDCLAVGSYSAAGVILALVERWNGTSWSIQSVPIPSGAISARLNSVSCTTAAACTAVGSYSAGGVYLALVERWDGSSWKLQSTPPPPSGSTFIGLNGVSCASATACTAVGGYNIASSTPGQFPLAESWNGSTWSLQSTPGLPGMTSGQLNSVSCTSAACFAVGNLGAIFDGVPMLVIEQRS
jgi:hypothetical protein